MARKLFRPFSSLRFRVLLIILFAILPALALFHYSNQEERKIEINRLKQQTLEIARIIAFQEADLLNGTYQLLKAISFLGEVKKYNPTNCHQLMAFLLSHYERYENFGIANSKGDVVCSAKPLQEKVNIADRLYFKEAMGNQRFAIGAFEEERITHRPGINLAYPIFGDDGKPVGVIFATLDLYWLAQYEDWLASKMPQAAILTKVDKNGIILVRFPNGKNLIGHQAPEKSVVAKALKENEGIITATGPDGQTWVYAFTLLKSKIYQADVHLILAQPEDVLLASVNHRFNRNLLIMTIVGIMLLICTWFGSDFSFMRQIRSLQQITQRLTRGDLKTRYFNLPYGASEINCLGDSINQMAASLEKRQQELIEAYDATIEGWSRALDLRDKETEGHTLRVTEMTVKLARAAGMSEEEIQHVRRGALLHDIGKMGIPDQILLKPDKLTEEEWIIMRKHPVYAFELLSPIAYLRPALDIPYCHHEKWDGSGYPRGLKGEQIPLAARLFTVVDVWDALLSDRPYRQRWPREKAIEYIKSQSGKHFDPKAVELFLSLIEK